MSDRQDSNWDESHGSASSGISDSAGNAPEPEIISQEDYERLYHPTRDQCPAFQHRFQDREDYAESTLDPVLCEHGVDRRPVPFGQGLSQESSTPSAGFPSFKYNLLDYLDIEGPPSSLQSFANHAVIRMYNNHPEAFSGPLDPRKLPYPYHPSATLVLEVQQPPSKPATTPQSRQVHHSNLKRLCAANEYDPLWMKCNNVNEPVLEEVRSRKKFEELFRYEVIAQGDRLVMEVVYTTSQGEKILGEANFVVSEHFLHPQGVPEVISSNYLT